MLVLCDDENAFIFRYAYITYLSLVIQAQPTAHYLQVVQGISLQSELRAARDVQVIGEQLFESG